MKTGVFETFCSLAPRRDASDVGTNKSIKTAIFKAENDPFQPFFAFSFSCPNLTVNFIVCFAMQEQTFFDSPSLLGYVIITFLARNVKGGMEKKKFYIDDFF